MVLPLADVAVRAIGQFVHDFMDLTSLLIRYELSQQLVLACLDG